TGKSAGSIVWAYAYDNANHMVSATETVGGTLTVQEDYAYDALGNRVQTTSYQAGVGTSVTRYAYDGTDVWADLNGSNQLVERYVRPDDEDGLAARVSAGGTVAWYLTDEHGSVEALTDGAGAVQDTIRYNAFGQVVS